MSKLFVVVYRTGGTENFQWHRSLSMSYEQAVACAKDVRQGGRPAQVVDAALSASVGLPETYE